MKYLLLLTVLITILFCVSTVTATTNKNNNEYYLLDDLDDQQENPTYYTLQPQTTDDIDEIPTNKVSFYPFSESNELLQITIPINKTHFSQEDDIYQVDLAFGGFEATKDLDIHATCTEYDAEGNIISSKTQHHIMGTKKHEFHGKVSFIETKTKKNSDMSLLNLSITTCTMRLDIPIKKLTVPTIQANISSISTPNNAINDLTKYSSTPYKEFAKEIVVNTTFNKNSKNLTGIEYYNVNVTMNLITAPITNATSFTVKETFKNDQFIDIPGFTGPAPCKINDIPVAAMALNGTLVLPNDSLSTFGANITLTCQGIAITRSAKVDEGSNYAIFYHTEDAEAQNYFTQLYKEPFRPKWGFVLMLIAIGGAFDVVLIFLVLLTQGLLCFKKKEETLSLNDGSAYEKLD